jgi:hypothetical protein
MKTIDLSDLKAGDTAWSCTCGEEKVIFVYETEIKFGNTHYYKNGKFFEKDQHPTLFHSEQEFREYWGLGETLEVLESNQLTKREQFAMAALQGLSNSPYYGDQTFDDVAADAVSFADALLTKLNERT